MHCVPLPLSLRCSCMLMCHSPRKEYYKKFLFEPLPGGWAGWVRWLCLGRQALDGCKAVGAALCGCILPLQLCRAKLTMLPRMPCPAISLRRLQLRATWTTSCTTTWRQRW